MQAMPAKLTAPVYRLRRDFRGTWIVSWTGPDGKTKKRSCYTRDRKTAESVMALMVVELEKPSPLTATLDRLKSKRRR